MKSIKRAISIVGSQKKLAEKLGVSVSAVNHWAKGHRAPSPKNSVEIEKATSGIMHRSEFCDLFEKPQQ